MFTFRSAIYCCKRRRFMCHLSKLDFDVEMNVDADVNMRWYKRKRNICNILHQDHVSFWFHSFCNAMVRLAITSIPLHVSKVVIDNLRLVDFNPIVTETSEPEYKKKIILFGNSRWMRECCQCAILTFVIPMLFILSQWKDLDSHECSMKKVRQKQLFT